MVAVGLEGRSTAYVRRLPRRERAYWRRRWMVGELDGAPAVTGEVRSSVVDDDEAPGSSGVSWGGVFLRRSSATERGSELAIGAIWWAMWRGEVAGLLREKRGGERCVQFEARGAPFIAARRGQGCGAGRPWMRRYGG
jgi:hypothetical protein